MMKIFVAIVLFAVFALPAASASAHQDVITLKAYEDLLKSGASTDGITKSVISSPLLEEALVSYSKKKLGGLPTCGETCFGGTCNTPGCTCDSSWPICTHNSLEHTNSAAANTLLEESLVAFAKKGNLGGLPTCGETCFGGTCNTPGCTCDPWPVCTHNSLEHTNSAAANTLLEEALVAFAKKGNLGGAPVCGETCFGGTCNTPGCTCDPWPVCSKNSLAM